VFCRQCGAKQLGEGRFCSNCGASLEESEATLASPPIHEVGARGAAAGAGSSRPRWLAPAIGASAGILLLIVVVLVLFLAGVIGGKSDSLDEFATRVSPALPTLVTADQELADRVSSAATPSDLATVNEAATRVENASNAARGAVDVLPARGRQIGAKAALLRAIEANLRYARAVGAAASPSTLDASSAGTASSAATSARMAWSDVSTLLPQIPAPTSDLFSPTQLAVLARSEAARKKETAANTAAIRSYVTAIDGLLRNSAETRRDLTTLIQEAQDGAIGFAEAQARIGGVIAQRTTLQTQVAARAAPAPFARAAELLRQSITYSLDDDRAIQGIINAYYDGVDPSQFISAHQRATAQATETKRNFLQVYNRLRKRFLRLAPLPVDLRY
jgi:hypothetical protein